MFSRFIFLFCVRYNTQHKGEEITDLVFRVKCSF